MKELSSHSKSFRAVIKYLIVPVVLGVLGTISWIHSENTKQKEYLTSLYYEELQLQTSDRLAQQRARSVTQKIEEFERNLIKPTEAIKAKEILITPLRLNSEGKDRKTNLASATRKLRITFKTDTNSHIKIGMHDIYVRVMDRNNNMVGSDESKKIIVVDDQLQYTHKATINFTNKNQLYTIEWTSPESFAKGLFEMTLHADGYFMGRGSIALQ